jgi:ribonuclease-3
MLGRRHNPYRAIEKAIGYRFRKRDRLVLALTHPSFRFENPDFDADNQRLEFLGDAVLGVLAAAHLYREYDVSEGELTALRSRLARGETLSRLARRIGLHEHMRIGKGERRSGGHERASNLADGLEAVIGAVFLDGGFRACEKVFKHLFVPALVELAGENARHNPKGELQIRCQSLWKRSPTYRVIATDGPAHARVFTCEVTRPDGRTATGSGLSHRAAEVGAARMLLAEPMPAAPGEEPIAEPPVGRDAE